MSEKVAFSISADIYTKLRERYFYETDGQEAISLQIGSVAISLQRIELFNAVEYRIVVQDDLDTSLGLILTDLIQDISKVVPDSTLGDLRDDDGVFANDRGVADLISHLQTIKCEQFALNCGFTSYDFKIDRLDEALQAFLSPYYTIEDSVSHNPVMLAGVSCKKAYALASDLWSSFDYQAWNRRYGMPRILCRGEGFLFFELIDYAVLGRFRFSSLRDAVPTYYLKIAGQDTWYVLYDTGSCEGLLAPARALRSISNFEARKTGVWCIHASCFMLPDGRCYLICGDEYAGKTTQLIAALIHIPGSRLVTNDRAFVKWDGNRFVVYGYPHAIGIRRGTLLLSEKFKSLLGSAEAWNNTDGSRHGYSHSFPTKRSFAEGDKSQLESSIFFYPEELTSYLGTNVATQGSLAGVILPRYRQGTVASEWRQETDVSVLDIFNRHRHNNFENAQPFWNSLLHDESQCFEMGHDKYNGIQVFSFKCNEDLKTAWESFPGWIQAE